MDGVYVTWFQSLSYYGRAVTNKDQLDLSRKLRESLKDHIASAKQRTSCRHNQRMEGPARAPLKHWRKEWPPWICRSTQEKGYQLCYVVFQDVINIHIQDAVRSELHDQNFFRQEAVSAFECQ